MDVVRARRGVWLVAATGVIVLAVLGYAAFEFADHVAPAGRSGAVASPASTSPAASLPVVVPSGAAASVSGPASPSVSASRTTAPSRAATPAPQVALTIDSAVSFGPNGTSDGDNPQLAGNVLSDPSAGWMTDWYATSGFGGLAHGTGLLLDMGRTVTITSVRVGLGQTPGATLDLLAGTQPPSSAAALPVLATQANAAGSATLTPAKPTSARYILLWFTKLPPDTNGTYQATVHGITVEGR